MKSRTLVNLLGILLIYNLLIFYIGWGLWKWLQTFLEFNHTISYMFGVGITAYSLFIARFGPGFYVFKIIGSYWIALFQYAVILFPLANLAVFICHITSVPMNRSIFWVGNFTLGILVMLLIYGTFNAYFPTVRTYTIKITKRPPGLETLRIAMASDMHFGHLSGMAHLQRLVKNINALRPDLILFPGDIIDDEPGPFIHKNMGKVMKELTAPLGVYGVLGNHEYYGGKIPEFLEEMQSIGVNILMDEWVEIQDSFYILGRKDRTDKNRKSLEELLVGVDKSLPLIMMDHQPYHFDQAATNGIDVMLSGHTHRGQMAPNHLITRKKFELDWGYVKKNDLHVFVSSGFGFWGPPIRIGSRSEIVLIDIAFV
jgi:uncharacterized protein